MALLVTDRKFFSQIANDESFSSNLTDFGTHLKGSVMERIKAVYTLDVFWNSKADDVNTFTFENVSGNTWIIGQPVNNFIDEGWTTGDLLDLVDTDGTPAAVEGTVDWVAAQEMQITFVAPITGAGGLTSILHGKTPLEGLVFGFGLLQNIGESFNSISKVTGEDQGFTASGVGAGSPGPRSTAFVPCDPLGPFFGWQSGSCRVKYDSNPSTYVQRFILEHDFVLLPYYIDGQINDLLNVLPPTLFAGNNSIKYAIQTEFRNVLSNPNTSKTGTDEALLGSVGWFNENYNGLNNEYSVSSITYENAAAVNVAGILVGETTTVKIRVLSDNSTFTGASKFGIYRSRLPALADYSNSLNDYTTIWFYEGKIQTIGAGAVAGTIISNLTGTLIGAGEIEISFDIDYTLAQQAEVDANDFYLLGVQVADTTLDTDDSDKVMLIADVENYVKSADVPGLLTATKMDFVPHPITLGVDSVTDYKGWVEDGVLLDYEFKIDLGLGAFIQSMSFKLIAYNPTTEEQFELSEYALNLSNQVLVPSGGFNVQQIILNADRGFPLALGDQFNLVTLSTDSLVGNEQFYSGQIGFKIDWQDWIANSGVDSIFYDNAKPNNNLNNKASNYSQLNGYEIRAVLDFQISDGATLTQYQHSSPKIIVQDYDADGLGPDWTVTITTENQSAVDITPAILGDENTRIKALFDQLSGPVTDLTDYYGIIRIEEQNQPGYQINELSTINTPPTSGNILIPVPGETLCKMTLVGGDILLEADVDFQQKDPAKSYSISARLGSKTIAAPVSGKLKEDGTSKFKEDGDNKFKES